MASGPAWLVPAALEPLFASLAAQLLFNACRVCREWRQAETLELWWDHVRARWPWHATYDHLKKCDWKEKYRQLVMGGMLNDRPAFPPDRVNCLIAMDMDMEQRIKSQYEFALQSEVLAS